MCLAVDLDEKRAAGDRTEKELIRLEMENAQLRELLGISGVPIDGVEPE